MKKENKLYIKAVESFKKLCYSKNEYKTRSLNHWKANKTFAYIVYLWSWILHVPKMVHCILMPQSKWIHVLNQLNNQYKEG
jgi:hypothetical protein